MLPAGSLAALGAEGAGRGTPAERMGQVTGEREDAGELTVSPFSLRQGQVDEAGQWPHPEPLGHKFRGVPGVG